MEKCKYIGDCENKCLTHCLEKTMEKNKDIKLPISQKTGEFMFQFDNDEPILICGVMDFEKVKICLKQDEKGHFSNTNPMIEFKSGYGKSLKLFIKNI